MYEGTADIFRFPAWGLPAATQAASLHLAIVLAILSGFYAVWRAWKVRSLYPLFVYLGAGFSMLYEPLGDILTKVAYPPLNQVSLITLFGRPTPLWMLPNYFFFFSLPVLLLDQFVVKPDTTTRRWWLTFAGVALFVVLFEQPGINSDGWRYYGVQAFSINTYPIWVAFANSSAMMIIATLIAALRRTIIPSSLSFLFVPLMPFAFIGAHIGGTILVASAIYSTTDLTVINTAAILSIATCILNVWVAYEVIRRIPQDEKTA